MKPFSTLKEIFRITAPLRAALTFWGRMPPVVQIPAYIALTALHAWPWAGIEDARTVLPRTLAAGAVLLVTHITCTAAAGRKTPETGQNAAKSAPQGEFAPKAKSEIAKAGLAAATGAGAVAVLTHQSEETTNPEVPPAAEESDGWEDLLAGIVD